MMRTALRNADLRKMLSTRRTELQDDLHERIRHGRVGRPDDVRDDVEHSDDDSQGEIEFTLLQMRAEMLVRIEEALVRLDAGDYGSCFECAQDISEERLRALPFAVRCQACQERRERREGPTRQRVQQRASLSLFSDTVSS